MTFSKISAVVACGLLLAAGCKKEPSEPAASAQIVEVKDSNGVVAVGYVYPAGSVGSIKGTNGEVIPATAQITGVTIQGESAAGRGQVVSANGTNWFLGNTLINGTNVGSNGVVSIAARTNGARKVEVVTTNGTYDWYLGDTLINGTNAGTNRVASVQRITGIAKELAPTNKPARPSSGK